MLSALLLLLVPMTAPAEPPTPTPDAAPRPLRIVLIGASIARGWQLDGFAARTGRSDVVVEYVGEYGFDKSKSVAALLARGAATGPTVATTGTTPAARSASTQRRIIASYAAWLPGK